MTETRKWAIGTAVVVAALLVGTWFLLVSPKRADATSLKVQTASQIAANEQLRTQIAVLQDQNKDLPAMQAKVARLYTKIPADAQLPTLIQQLSQAADKAGVELVALTPTAPAPLAPVVGAVVAPTTTLNEITLSLTVNGGYFELQQYFNELENMPRALLVTKVDMTEETATADTSTDPTTTSSSTTPALTAEISAQVFLSPPPTATTATTPAP
ncbi:MAG: type 4a pilus biogenesis protein PilO [Actinomycetes bacterium]